MATIPLQWGQHQCNVNNIHSKVDNGLILLYSNLQFYVNINSTRVNNSSKSYLSCNHQSASYLKKILNWIIIKCKVNLILSASSCLICC